MRYFYFLAVLFSGMLMGQHIDPYVNVHLQKMEKAGMQEDFRLIVSGEENIAEQLENEGFRVQTRIPGFATVSVNREGLGRLIGQEGIKRISMNPRKEIHNDLAVPYQNVHEAYGKGYTGTNVIVGVVDTGIDFYNPLFRNGDGSTRILYIWDQTSGGASPPGGYAYGDEYTEVQINSDLDSGVPNSIVPQVDTDGHGTHVTGSVAGIDLSMSPDTLFGSAKEANIIFVKTTFWGADILDAVEYIFAQATAAGKPAVVNLSLGSQYGPHDGKDDETTAMDALTGPGKVVVRSAGNSGGDFVHYYANSVVTNDDIVFAFCQYVTAWLEVGDSLSSATLNWETGSIDNLTVGGSENSANVYMDVVHSTMTGNSKIAIYIFINNQDLQDKTFTLTLNSLADMNDSETIERHAWTSDHALFSPYGGFSQGSSYSGMHYPYTLGNEACGNNVIAVGAFMSREWWQAFDGNTYHYVDAGSEGGIANFSSIGPTADERQKPDIVAGGTQIISGKSKDASYSDPFVAPVPFNDRFSYSQGTSMSSPVAAGAIALLLEKNPSWSHMEVMNYLSTNAQGTSSDSSETVVKTKNDPNTWDRVFGFGAIDLTDAFTSTSIGGEDGALVKEYSLEQNYPNPFNPSTVITYQLPVDSRVDLVIYNALGQKVRTLLSGQQRVGQHELTWDGRNDEGQLVSSGVYFYQLKAGEYQQVKKMMLLK